MPTINLLEERDKLKAELAAAREELAACQLLVEGLHGAQGGEGPGYEAPYLEPGQPGWSPLYDEIRIRLKERYDALVKRDEARAEVAVLRSAIEGVLPELPSIDYGVAAKYSSQIQAFMRLREAFNSSSAARELVEKVRRYEELLQAIWATGREKGVGFCVQVAGQALHPASGAGEKS